MLVYSLSEKPSRTQEQDTGQHHGDVFVLAGRMVLVFVAAETDAEEDRWPGEAGSSSCQEHVHAIAALQRVQASQANYSNHPALDISRPKLRDNRQASFCCCMLGRTASLCCMHRLNHSIR